MILAKRRIIIKIVGIDPKNALVMKRYCPAEAEFL